MVTVSLATADKIFNANPDKCLITVEVSMGVWGIYLSPAGQTFLRLARQILRWPDASPM